MMNLFEMNEKYRELEENETLDATALKDTLDAISDAREVKLDNIASWIEKNKAQIDWVTKRVKDLQAKKVALTNLNKSLQEYMTAALDDAGLKELQTENYIIKPRNYRASTVVDNLDDLPADFKNTKTEVVADKTKIYKALSAGEDVPGAYLKPNRGTTIK